MSDFVQHNSTICPFTTNSSWVVLSSIEMSIKKKVESIGTPLKDWNIQIYRGILTGRNEAFIISPDTREKILNNCLTGDERTRTDAIIRPVLRGRNIDRYSYKWAGEYLIATFPSRHYNIDEYPSLKSYLLSFDKRVLAQSGEKDIDGIKGKNARKKTCNKWFETQDSIGYWDNFSKQKIAYRQVSTSMDACLVESGYLFNDKCYFIVGEHLIYLLCVLNSSLFDKVYFSAANTTGGKGGPAFLNNIYIPKPNDEEEQYIISLYEDFKNERIKQNDFETLIDTAVNKIFKL